jgi:hypothetical protein
MRGDAQIPFLISSGRGLLGLKEHSATKSPIFNCQFSIVCVLPCPVPGRDGSG